MGGYVYRLFLEDGRDVGTFTTAAWDWSEGHTFFDGEHREWRTLGVAPAAGADFKGLFTVEPVGEGETRSVEPGRDASGAPTSTACR